MVMKKIGNWYANGDTRTRRVFLVLPRTQHHSDNIEGGWNRWKETRWLEWATIKERYDGEDWYFLSFIEEGL
jgi:hypothetical protein